MPFDSPPTPQDRPERRRRIPLPKTTLKQVILDAYFVGLITMADADAMIDEFGLRHD